MIKCGSLTYKAKKQGPLQRSVADESFVKDRAFREFVTGWVQKFREPTIDNPFERFVYMWVTFNAWASLVVPDRSRNHQDSYLIHSVASDDCLQLRFIELQDDTGFAAATNKLVALGPVFQVLWIRNKYLQAWNAEQESREDYVRHLMDKDPYHPSQSGGIPAFAPACAEYHLSKEESIPNDWPHVLHMIYLIRCNLFHGGKTYDSTRDRLFVELASDILRAVWMPEINRHLQE
jgi:hypothetical protein